MSFDPLRSENNASAADQPSPFNAPSPAPKKRRVWLWVLSIFFGGGFLCLLICCGVGAYLVQNYGSAMFEPARAELNQLADIREQVGMIDSLTINFSDSIDEAKTNPEFFILKGAAETGPVELSVKMSNTGELEKVFLVLPDESRKPIDLQRHVGSSVTADQPSSRLTEPAEQENAPSESASQAPEQDSTAQEQRDRETELERE